MMAIESIQIGPRRGELRGPEPAPRKMFAPVKLTIPGCPVVLKNSRRLITDKTGRRRELPSAKASAYMDAAVLLLREQWSGPPITGPVNLRIRSYGPWRRDSGTLPDASNLYQAPEDCLQAAGILANDRQVESHDGSRRICLCDDCDRRGKYKSGEWKPNCGAVGKCPLARVEIRITEADDG